MAKRQRVLNSTSRMTRDSHSITVSLSNDEDSDVQSQASSYSPKRKAKKAKVNQIPESDAVESVLHRQPAVECKGDALSHSASGHVIHTPGPIRIALLRWYAGVHTSRGMPWRKPYDPLQGPEERAQRAYEVWVSEIMLQQTQVATVIPYYTRWMENKRMHTTPELCGKNKSVFKAAANVDEVNALWKGLGYYSRASRLLAGAQKAVAQYKGRLPDNAKDMEANIPGIGRYSAGAICSIAYGEHVPVLDGNVHRLMSRFLALHAPPKAKATLDLLWAAAAAMVAKGPESNTADTSSPEFTQYPGDINQALIELGSTVCKVREPTCQSCPLRPWCGAYEVSKSGHKPIPDIEDACTICEPPQSTGVTAYPMRVDRKKPREELDIVNVIEWYPMGLLAGLYEFPTSSNVAKTTSRTAQAKIPHALLSQLVVPSVFPHDAKKRTDTPRESIEISSIKPVGDVIHVFSHIKKTYRPQWVVLQGGETPPALKPSGVEPSASPGVIDDGEGGISTSLRPISAMWVQLKEISSVNMGTGVVKVWNSTKALWEREIGGS
ncbi:hypothetical protein D9615_004998 [Tricholomella constricta]|uniref:HhH-GPD domain-containing protein n=1 Tax=Tricholomella constricta TaxID=117010 RepID=A0A8H5HH05_9AGAR|nr:hypothetical protein D9615_004998 [Tricholomella constricta]